MMDSYRHFKPSRETQKIFGSYLSLVAVLAFFNFIASSQFCLSQDQASSKKPAEIEPRHVFQKVTLVAAEVESIRFIMGRPENKQPEMKVKGAVPREVYFQALSMLRKADRLCFELTYERIPIPEKPKHEIRPADVFGLVELTLQRVQRIKKKLDIKTKNELGELPENKTPTDVFKLTVQVSRQLNLLLEKRFAPSDVFQQVTYGVGYAARLLEQFPDTEPLPAAPGLVEGKRPVDVYRRILDCLTVVRKIATRSGLEFMEIEIDREKLAADPSDVYDIASLLVSELDFIHSKIRDAKPPRKVFYVGRKFPSHVFQRAGMLELQLNQLEKLVEENKDWLKPAQLDGNQNE